MKEKLNLFASLSVEIILQIKLDIYTCKCIMDTYSLKVKLALLILTRINKSEYYYRV